MRTHGFSLLELLFAMVILAVILTIAIPSFQQMLASTHTYNQTRELYAAIQLTRSYAVTKKSRATLTHDNGWNSPWYIYVDRNNNGKRDEDEPILWEGFPSAHVHIRVNQSSMQQYISFISTGAARQQSAHSRGGLQIGTFTVCGIEETAPAYQLVLSSGGRTRLVKNNTGICSS